MMSAFPGRSGATKDRMLREGGGNERSEAAVARGLAWLAKQQRTDGSWVFDGEFKEEVIAATGLALAAFLGAGETHKQAQKYRATVERGLQYLMKNCPVSGPNMGKFTNARTMYAQAIGTLALCEAYGMTKDPALKPYAQAAINFIVRSQAPDGSWGYSPGSLGDTSIVGWQIQALQAARLSKDIVVDPNCIKKAVEFLNKVSAGSLKAMYGYRDAAGAAPGTALTAVGLLCRYYVDGWGPDNAAMAEGVQGLLQRNPPRFGNKVLGPEEVIPSVFGETKPRAFRETKLRPTDPPATRPCGDAVLPGALFHPAEYAVLKASPLRQVRYAGPFRPVQFRSEEASRFHPACSASLSGERPSCCSSGSTMFFQHSGQIPWLKRALLWAAM